MKRLFQPNLWLVIGDIVVLLIITMIGFISHREAIDWQILSTFLPYLISWGLIAPWLGVYQSEITQKPAQVWRPMLAAFLAAPMAGWLRGIWLNSAIIPVFVLVLGLSASLGFGIWRLIMSFAYRRLEQYG